MSKFVCKYCGLGPATYATKGPHVGEWCSFCKRWIRNVENNTVEKEIAPTVKTIDDIVKEDARLRYEEGLAEELPWYD